MLAPLRCNTLLVGLPNLWACLVLMLKLIFKCFNDLCSPTTNVIKWSLRLVREQQQCKWSSSKQQVHPDSYLIFEFDISPQFVVCQFAIFLQKFSRVNLSFLHNLPIFSTHIRYTQLLAVIEEIGKDIRPTYAGSKSSAERLKRGEREFKIKFWAKIQNF